MKALLYEYYETPEEISDHIRGCEGRHQQCVSFSTFHHAFTQVCFGCQVIRSNIKVEHFISEGAPTPALEPIKIDII